MPDILPILRLRNVAKCREKGGVRFELLVPTLDIAGGELLAVVGQSGCGKSTLLDLLGLVSRADTAEKFEVRVSEGSFQDVTELNESRSADIRRRLLGYVLQDGGLLPFLTVYDNVSLPRRLNRMPEDRALVQSLLDTLGIGMLAARKPSQLSGGQRQRAAIARALAHAPRVVLADEPTAAVDHARAVEILDLLCEITARQQVALVLVTHDCSLLEGRGFRRVGFHTTMQDKGLTQSILTASHSTSDANV